jgi:hypothetical protein
MKTIITFLCLCIGLVSAQAQKKSEQHISFTGKKDLVLNIRIADSITIHTWNKPEVYYVSLVNINDNQDNDAYETSVDESDNSLRVNAGIKDGYMKEKKCCCNDTRITWDIYIPEKTSFSVESINANIVIDGVTSQVRAKSISGFIDLALASGRNADLEMKTISGTLYTDLDIQSKEKSGPIPSVVKQKINQGGDEISLETISGDIFVRKGE